MTNKEAIERIKHLIAIIKSPRVIMPYCKEEMEALNLAIKALEEKPQDDLIKAFELLKEHCKNRECNKDCVFYRELRIGYNTEQYCGLCEIVLNDDEEAEKK